MAVINHYVPQGQEWVELQNGCKQLIIQVSDSKMLIEVDFESHFGISKILTFEARDSLALCTCTKVA